MASGNFIMDKGFRATAALTKFYAVKAHASAVETCVPVTGDTDVILGFVQYGVTAAEILKGKGASVRMAGITEAVATGAIALGAQVTLATDGRVTSAASGKRVVGTCVGNISSTSGTDRISLLIETSGQLAP